MSVFVIAEAGSTHDGSLDRAVRLVEIASHAGADAVKFQWWSDAKLLAGRRKAPDLANTYARFQMPREWLAELAGEARLRGLYFMCTACLPDDVAVVARYVDWFKVASFEAQDHQFIRLHYRYARPIVISTGLMNSQELSRIKSMRRLALPNYPDLDIRLLHCISAYPAQLEELNLAVIRVRELDGFSDHTGHLLTGGIAAAAGAAILEVHFRAEDTAADNPDFPHSHDPDGLAAYISMVRRVERALGDGVRRLTPSEATMRCHVVGRDLSGER